MARRRRKARRTTSVRRRRRRNPMASVRYHGKPASRRRFHAAGYTRNPRRRHRYRRNPAGGIVRQTTDLMLGAGAALVGAAAGRAVGNLIPFGQSDPVMGFVKGVAVAIGIRMVGPKVGLSPRLAELAAVGAIMGPTKDLIVSFVPQAGQFLGAGPMAFPRPIYTPRRLAAYSGAPAIGDGDGLGSYSGGSPSSDGWNV
jgi:hypothetical protein